MPILSYLGFASILYALLDFLSYFYTDEFCEAHKGQIRLHAFTLFIYILLFLSLPVAIVYGGISGLYSTRMYKRRTDDIHRALYIHDCRDRPSNYYIDFYGFKCDGFTDEDGNFDLNRWKKHEFDMMGL